MSDASPPDGDSDRTWVPTPRGGKRPPAPVPAAPAEPVDEDATVFGGAVDSGDETVMQQRPVLPPAIDPPLAASLPVFDSPNPLLGAAAPLLSLVGVLRTLPLQANLDALRRQLEQAFQTFEQHAQQARVIPEELDAARYALCSLLDETIAATPWGGNGGWAAKSMLLKFYNETWGGEKFFAILDRRSKNPAAHLDLLELLFVCISLGFEGRYHQAIKEGGRAQLDQLREGLYELIRRYRPALERDLSPHWQGVVDRGRRLGIEVPLWVIAAGVALLLAVFHIGFGMRLNALSDPVFARIHALDVAPVAAPPPAKVAVTAAPLPRLAELLRDDIGTGMLAVDEGKGRATVTLHGDGLFGSGSATIDPVYRPVLERIRDALHTYPGTVLVTGHTDDQRIVSSRFASNWRLSLERAQAVVQLLSVGDPDPGRFRALGRGETEPLVPNSSPENRARNRRVDITIAGAPGG